MSSTVAAIRTALATVTSTSGVTTYDKWPGHLNPPAAVVSRRHTDYGTQFNGGHTSIFQVTIFVLATIPEQAQDALDVLVDPAGTASTSAITAIGADTTLGGLVRSLYVDSVEESGLTELAGVSYLSAAIPVTIVHE